MIYSGYHSQDAINTETMKYKDLRDFIEKYPEYANDIETGIVDGRFVISNIDLLLNLKLANLVAFLAIVLGVVLVGQIISSLLRRVVQLLQLGSFDHSVGAFFGFLQGCLLFQVFQ